MSTADPTYRANVGAPPVAQPALCSCPTPRGSRCPAHPEAPSGPDAAETLRTLRAASRDALDGAEAGPLLRETVDDGVVAAIEVAIRGLGR